MHDAPLSCVDWPSAVRLIESRYPPIDLFEDLADPEDWELLAAADMVPFANNMVKTFGNGAEFETPGQLIPTSIRMLAE